MGRTELEDILAERGVIEVTCEYCSERYRFDKVDVENILSQQRTVPESEIKH
jgi:molecular chaperone Hsp33